jgi:hypothetical protein
VTSHAIRPRFTADIVATGGDGAPWPLAIVANCVNLLSMGSRRIVVAGENGSHGGAGWKHRPPTVLVSSFPTTFEEEQ